MADERDRCRRGVSAADRLFPPSRRPPSCRVRGGASAAAMECSMNTPRSPLRFTHPSSEAAPELRSLLESANDDDPSRGDLKVMSESLRSFGLLPIAASSTALAATQTAATTHAAQGAAVLSASKGIFVGLTVKAVAIGIAAGVAGGTLVATVVKARTIPAHPVLVVAQAPARETPEIVAPLPIPAAAPVALIPTSLPAQSESAPVTTTRRTRTHVAARAATETPSHAVETEPAPPPERIEAIPVTAP